MAIVSAVGLIVLPLGWTDVPAEPAMPTSAYR
jgi:hypothetical protein